MYIHGSFKNQIGDTVTVYILTDGDITQEKEIGSEADGLFFTDNPVEITSEVNDTFDHLLRQSATIRLLSRDFLEGAFCTSCRDAVVNIYRGETCLFAGYIEPQSYSQPFNEVLDEVELNCIDVLSALQYSKYLNIGRQGVDYDTVKAAADMRSFYDIVVGMLDDITASIDIVGGGQVRYLYDGSQAIDSAAANRYTILRQLSVNDLLFLEDDEDDVWTQEQVLEEVMRYLNLHITQVGLQFYIFSWQTIKEGASVTWRNVKNGTLAPTAYRNIEISNDNAADTDTTISMGEVYNQLLLTCKTTPMDEVIESPLDADLLSSPYSIMQKYCTEYSADGNGRTAFNAFRKMMRGEYTDYGEGRITDWYVRVKSNEKWIFPLAGDVTDDIIEHFCWQHTHQERVPNYLAGAEGAAIIALGSIDTNTAHDDNSPVSKVNMTDYMVVPVNGNQNDEEGHYYPDAADIQRYIPYAVYTGNTAGGSFSPVDDAITNYIVLSGKVILNPIMGMTDTYRALKSAALTPGWEMYYQRTAPSRDNGDGRYYTRQYWKAERPKDADDVEWDQAIDYGLTPFTGKGPEQYEFKYSAVGDGTDTISKVSVLACMLIIGDKCVVETGTQGQVTDFTWQTYKERSQCASDDEYYQQCFYIGFDPKIGDKLIGTEFSLQNNINYNMGVDAEGIAIPIRHGDNVSGAVKFMILGPVNCLWDEVTRRHPTFFRHTQWSSTTIPLLAHVSSIMVKDFEIKVYSDNGKVDSTGNNDIVYMSDTQEEFTNRKDDIEFSITSALTAAECEALDVINAVNISTPVNSATGEGVVSIYDYGTSTQAKPEQQYVDSYYTEWHRPRVEMEQKLMDKGDTVSIFNHYTHPAMAGKTFFVEGVSRNLMEGRADMKIKEVEDD